MVKRDMGRGLIICKEEMNLQGLMMSTAVLICGQDRVTGAQCHCTAE